MPLHGAFPTVLAGTLRNFVRHRISRSYEAFHCGFADPGYNRESAKATAETLKRDARADAAPLHRGWQNESRYALPAQRQKLGPRFKRNGADLPNSPRLSKSRPRLARIFSCLDDGLYPILSSISAGVVPISLIGVVH